MGQAVSGVSGFADMIDLASERLGGRAIACSDDFFAPMTNLLKPGKAVFIPDRFTDLGKWMDGWESRRKRGPGHDWCVVALGRPGLIRAVNVDTAHFKGNQPEAFTLEAAELPGAAGDPEVFSPGVPWTELVVRTPLMPDSEHMVAVGGPDGRGEPGEPAEPGVPRGTRFTHVRLNIFPDGGVARLRVHGEVQPDWDTLRRSGEPIDLASAANGGLVVACNDMHFGSRHNLITPGRAANMGDGWETRRKRGLRGGEFDWCVVRLGRRGVITRVEVDTNHFKGNYPESCAVEVCDAPDAPPDGPDAQYAGWLTLLPRATLRGDTRHEFEPELDPAGRSTPCTHARMRIFPDGGVSRLRLFGRPA